MKKFLLVLLVLIIVTALLVVFSPDDDVSTVIDPTNTDIRQVQTLDVGLNAEDEAVWRHLDEGSGFLPLSFFYALKDEKTGKPFIEILPRFGFIQDPGNNLGLPIGLTAGRLESAPNNSLFAGVNCAACHSGQYTYNGTAFVIDGAPNMLNFEALLDALKNSLTKTVSSPKRLFQMIHAMMQWEQKLEEKSDLLEMHPDVLDVMSDIANSADDHQTLTEVRQHVESGLYDAYHIDTEARQTTLQNTADHLVKTSLTKHVSSKSVLQKVQDSVSSLHDDITFIRSHVERLLTLHSSFAGETVAGPGRADSFDAIWDLLIQKDQLMPMTAPVSIPQLFDYANYKWVHWDGNTTGVMDRDYAQAIALGADFNPKTADSSVIPQSVIKFELTAKKIMSPVWPADILGAIDMNKASRGEKHFEEHCLRCHSDETLTSVDEVGTDPGRAANFARLRQDGKSYAQLLADLGKAVIDKSLTKHGLTRADIRVVEHSDQPVWRITNAYHSRPLKGIWASAPYLHNGSVPTLWDLLQVETDRPKEFLVGRELDPEKVGIDAQRQTDEAWVFGTRQVGNSNKGHTYGVHLKNTEKSDLLEYLKTL